MDDSSRKKIIVWLLCGCFLIFAMVVVGGITRLTGSGLSITEWNVVMGAVPPLNDQQWNDAFEKYKTIPQFQEVNYNFSLSDFKNIFWWEYLHRLIGRMIGVVFLVPFFYFLIKKQLDKKLICRVVFLFFLGGLQGFLGWYMVKSGLSERTSVSHYRLAIHLFAAFITFGFTLWYALDLIYENSKEKIYPGKKFQNTSLTLLLIVLLQVVYGAFTAGLKAGRIANTFPTMDGEWIPSSLFVMQPWSKNLFENLVTVQFIHRCFAYLIFILVVVAWFRSRKMQLVNSQRSAINFLLLMVCIQFGLGIATLLTSVKYISLAVLHQAGAFFLFAGAIIFFHRFLSKPEFETSG